MSGSYVEIAPPERLEGPRTRVTVSNRFEHAAERDAHMKLGAHEGWSQSFEELDQVVTERSGA